MSGARLAPARWRLALRFARREVQRRPGRTVLVALLIAVPIMGMTLGSVYAHTQDERGERDFPMRYGDGADMAAEGPASGKDSVAFKGVEAVLPEGSTVTRVIGNLYLPIQHGDDTLTATLVQFDGEPGNGFEPLGLETDEVPKAGEAWVSRHLLDELELEVGDTLSLQYPSGSWTIAGSGRPGINHREDVIVFAELPRQQFRKGVIGGTTIIDLPPGAELAERRQVADTIQARYGGPQLQILDDVGSVERGPKTSLAWGWVAGIIALAAVGIVISAAFATSARRQLVMVGQLSANGAPQRLIGRALGLQGFWTGVAGVALGMSGAALIGVFGRSTIERVMAKDLPTFQYVPRDLVVIALTGIAAAVVAAYVPARSAAKVPTLTALAGRRPLGKVPARLVPIGIVIFGFGVLLLVLAAGSDGGGDAAAAAGVLGGVMVMAGMCCCSPLAIDAMSRLAARAGRSWRFAGRSLGRTRARSAAIVTAIAVTGALAAAGSSLALSAAEEEDRALTYPDDAVVVLPMGDDGFMFEEGADPKPRTSVEIPGELRQGVLDVLPDVSWSVRREATFDPESPEEALGNTEDELGITAYDTIVVGDDAMQELYELSDTDRESLERTGALALQWYYFGREPVPDEVDVVLQADGQPITITAATREYLQSMVMDADGNLVRDDTGVVTGHDALMITQDRAESLGLDIVERGAIARNGTPITAGQQRQLDEVPVTDIDGRTSLSSIYRDAPRTQTIEGWSLAWERLPNQAPARIAQLVIVGVATALILLVVTIGLSLAATESRDERDVLVAVGAKPATMRRMAGVKAAVLTLTGVMLAIPTGLIPLWAVMRTLDEPFAMPWTQLAVMLFGLPLVVGAAAWAVSSIAQRARPVRMSNLVFE